MLHEVMNTCFAYYYLKVEVEASFKKSQENSGKGMENRNIVVMHHKLIVGLIEN